jgi:hypothetical protein
VHSLKTGGPPRCYNADGLEDDEPIPLCGTCGAPVGIFPELTLNWRHYRGDATAYGPHHTNDPGHTPEVAWYLPDEDPADF